MIKNTLKQTKFEDKTVESTQLSLVLVGLHNFQIFPGHTAHVCVCMCEAWKWETYVRSQSFSSESAVKYLHGRRRKIQISPPLGEQDQSNAPPQGQRRQSNPHPMPCLPTKNLRQLCMYMYQNYQSLTNKNLYSCNRAFTQEYIVR